MRSQFHVRPESESSSVVGYGRPYLRPRGAVVQFAAAIPRSSSATAAITPAAGASTPRRRGLGRLSGWHSGRDCPGHVREPQREHLHPARGASPPQYHHRMLVQHAPQNPQQRRGRHSRRSRDLSTRIHGGDVNPLHLGLVPPFAGGTSLCERALLIWRRYLCRPRRKYRDARHSLH